MIRGTVISAALYHADAHLGSAEDSNCGYVSDKVQYVNVSDIDANGPVYIGKEPLPARFQGVFWLVDDGGDALVSFGKPEGGDDSVECNNGKLSEDTEANSEYKYCTTVSTVRPGGWTFQAQGTPWPFGGAFPTAADEFYRTCGTKWKFCLDAMDEPTKLKADPIAQRGLPCVNVFAAASTTGEYKGTKDGGEYWRVTTKAVGVIPLPSFIPGNFDMIQVMDADGSKIQPAWDNFAAKNEQIVYYEGVAEKLVV